MLTVTTRDAAVFTIDYRPYNDSGLRLFARLTDQPHHESAGMGQVPPDQWYLLNVLNPMPPLIGQDLTLVLQSADQDTPIVHRTTTVMSVVGTL